MTPTLLDRRYAILGPLGRGGMGDVFRARDVRVDRDVAVKLLAVEHSENPAFVRRFRREIQTLARLAHPNIVTLLDTGEAPDGRLYLVMECLTGETLSTMLDDLRARGEVIGWRRLAPIVRQIGHALAAAHALGVVHRDIKPSNCFRSDDVPGNPDYIRLLDFGIVKTLPGEGGLDRGETTQRVFIGTPHYAAPETFDPETYGPAGVQADIFSLGVLMYRCLTGTLPFESLQPSAAIARAAYHLAEPPRLRAPERDIPVAVEAILMRAMALRPEARHASVADLLAEIELSLATPVAARSRRASSGPITEVRPKAMAAAGGLASLYPATAAPSRPASAAASRAGVVSGELLCDATPRLPTLAKPVYFAPRVGMSSEVRTLQTRPRRRAQNWVWVGLIGIAGIAAIGVAGRGARDETQAADDVAVAPQTARSAQIERSIEPVRTMPAVVHPSPTEPPSGMRPTPELTPAASELTPAAPPMMRPAPESTATASAASTRPGEQSLLKEEARAALTRVLAEAEADAVTCARNAGVLLGGYEPYVMVVNASVRPPSTAVYFRGSSRFGKDSALAEAERCLLRKLRARRVKVPAVAVSETRRYEL